MFHTIYFALAVSAVNGWGGDGHRTIASVATTVMSDESRRFLENAIGEMDLGQASVWADTQAAEAKYPRSGAFHFSNTPYRNCDAFDYARDCGVGSFKGICIVSGLVDAISRAIDENVSDTVRSDSLKFILHLMADIHQPLHTGFRADSGGVRILLGVPRNTSLHYIWDNWMIEELERRNGSVDTVLQTQLAKNGGRFASILRAKTNMTDILSSEQKIFHYVSSIASETATTVTCNAGYKDASNHWIGVGAVIGETYYKARQPVLIVQLLKAAVRLGILMDGIREKVAAQKVVAKAKRRAELFAGLSVPAGITPESSNYFGQLYVEFDPESVVSTDIEVTRSPESASRTLMPSYNETEAIETAILKSEIEKRSYTFSGVDISQLRLHVYRGRNIVTDTSLKEFLSTRRDIHVTPVQTASKSGEVKTTLFEFDGTILPLRLSDDVIIRIILKISGVDPRIDITDYLETIKPHTRIDDAISSSIIGMLAPRTMKLVNRRAEDRKTMLKRISDMSSKVLWKALDDISVGIMHRDTLDSWSTSGSPMIRLTKLPYFADTEMGRPQFGFVDPKLLNQPFLLDYAGAIMNELNKFPRKNPFTSTRTYEHVMWKELAEISSEIQYQWWKMGDGEERKHIEWVFEYAVYADTPGDLSLDIVEAVRKGYFNTTDELIEYISTRDP